MLDGLLRHVGQHGVGAAEGDHRHLGEEPGDVGQHATHRQQQRDRPEPEHHGHQSGATGRGGQAGDAVRLARQQRVQRGGQVGGGTLVGDGGEAAGQRPAQCGGRQHHRGEGQVEQEQREEGRRRHGPGQRTAQGAPAHPQQRLDHQHQHGAFETEEQRRHQRHLAQRRVDRRERQHHRGARQDEEQPGRHAAAHAMHEPAEIGGELHRLRARQQHAEVERVQEPRLADPAAAVHHLAVHQRDLRRRAAEGEAADPGPDPQRLALRWHGAHAGLPAGQLCVSSVASRHQR